MIVLSAVIEKCVCVYTWQCVACQQRKPQFLQTIRDRALVAPSSPRLSEIAF